MLSRDQNFTVWERPMETLRQIYQTSPRWLVEGMIPSKYTTVLTAPTNVGKSIFALDIALSVAMGKESLLGKWPIDQSAEKSVLYVDGEGSIELYAERLFAWMTAKTHISGDTDRRLQENFKIVGEPKTGFGKEKPDGNPANEMFNAIWQYIYESDKLPSLIVLDTWSSLKVIEDSNNEAQAQRVLNEIRVLTETISEQTPCAVLLVAHPSKSASQVIHRSDFLDDDAVSGSARVMRDAWSSINMSWVGGEDNGRKRRIQMGKNRRGERDRTKYIAEMFPFPLPMSGGDEPITAPAFVDQVVCEEGDLAPKKKRKNRGIDALVDVLAEKEEPMSLRELCRADHPDMRAVQTVQQLFYRPENHKKLLDAGIEFQKSMDGGYTVWLSKESD